LSYIFSSLVNIPKQWCWD